MISNKYYIVVSLCTKSEISTQKKKEPKNKNPSISGQKLFHKTL